MPTPNGAPDGMPELPPADGARTESDDLGIVIDLPVSDPMDAAPTTVRRAPAPPSESRTEPTTKLLNQITETLDGERAQLRGLLGETHGNKESAASAIAKAESDQNLHKDNLAVAQETEISLKAQIALLQQLQNLVFDKPTESQSLYALLDEILRLERTTLDRLNTRLEGIKGDDAGGLLCEAERVRTSHDEKDAEASQVLSAGDVERFKLLHGEATEIQRELERVLNEIAEITVERTQAIARIQRFEGVVSKGDADRTFINDQKNDKSAQLSTVQNQISEIQRQLQSTEARLREKRGELTDIDAQITRLETSLEQINGQLALLATAKNMLEQGNARQSTCENFAGRLDGVRRGCATERDALCNKLQEISAAVEGIRRKVTSLLSAEAGTAIAIRTHFELMAQNITTCLTAIATALADAAKAEHAVDQRIEAFGRLTEACDTLAGLMAAPDTLDEAHVDMAERQGGEIIRNSTIDVAELDAGEAAVRARQLSDALRTLQQEDLPAALKRAEEAETRANAAEAQAEKLGGQNHELTAENQRLIARNTELEASHGSDVDHIREASAEIEGLTTRLQEAVGELNPLRQANEILGRTAAENAAAKETLAQIAAAAEISPEELLRRVTEGKKARKEKDAAAQTGSGGAER